MVNNINYDSGPSLHIWNVNHPSDANMTAPFSSTAGIGMESKMQSLPNSTKGKYFDAKLSRISFFFLAEVIKNIIAWVPIFTTNVLCHVCSFARLSLEVSLNVFSLQVWTKATVFFFYGAALKCALFLICWIIFMWDAVKTLACLARRDTLWHHI